MAEKLRKGEIKVVCAVDVLNGGADMPFVVEAGSGPGGGGSSPFSPTIYFELHQEAHRSGESVIAG